MGRAVSIIGTTYVGLLDKDKKLVGGYRRVGECYPFKIKVETEQKKMESRQRESAGQTLHTKNRVSAIGGSINIREWTAANLAWALSGTEVLNTAVAGTVADESVTLIADNWVRLAHQNISAVKIADAAEGSDFEVNAPLGLIRFITGGALSATAVSVAYSYAEESGYRVDIGNKSLVRVAIMIDGENEYTGEAISAVFDSVVLSSSAEISLISEPDNEYEELPFELSFETLPGKKSPGYINGLPL
ncbi:phage tail tube protein [Desulfotalea psychrophila]|uniref:Uncharacterized protein n=1 Tax=Desulfotalea psychrophila (strain LSv54 / DSM 12343) TaxID=177439 RepID=Q6AMV6_DESPS|nr:hypothetical protein [Desulfotalea psychrophila]CAG36318.1 unknown protein [Desulfotalea psychrophila LSv54]